MTSFQLPGLYGIFILHFLHMFLFSLYFSESFLVNLQESFSYWAVFNNLMKQINNMAVYTILKKTNIKMQ